MNFSVAVSGKIPVSLTASSLWQRLSRLASSSELGWAVSWSSDTQARSAPPGKGDVAPVQGSWG